MASPGHRANILNSNFKEIGMGMASGVYEGRPAVFVVELFGRPAEPYSYETAQVPVSTKVAKPASLQKTVVVSETSSSALGTKNLFLAVKGAEIREVPVSNAASQEVDVTGSTPTKITPVQKVLAEPGLVAQFLLYGLGGFMLLTLLLNVFIKIKIQHGRLIMNGALIVLFALALAAINGHLVQNALQII
jgi:hypothetical protein